MLQYSFAENATNKQKSIKVVTKNKICYKHSHFLDEGTAEPHFSTGVCGANLPMHHTIGDEFTWARELLCKEGLRVIEVSTDPDSSAGRAADSLYKDGLLQNMPVHFIDTRHLSETIRKSIKKDSGNSRIHAEANQGRTK